MTDLTKRQHSWRKTFGEYFWPHGMGGLLLLLFLISPSKVDGSVWHLGGVILLIEALVLLKTRFSNIPTARVAARDIGGALFLILLVWQILTVHLNCVNPMLIPSPEAVFKVLQGDFPDLIKGAGRTLLLFAGGYGLSLLVAIPLGVWVGWTPRLKRLAQPIVKFLGPLPPVVYVPYAIALMPTFRIAAISVVFIGAFWPLFVRTMQGVQDIPGTQIAAARTLGLKPLVMLRKVVFPGALPAICGGATLSIVFAFVLLTSAELIGASSGIGSGLGYYVMYADEIQDHRRVLAGVFFIGLVVAFLVQVADRIEKRLLRWQE